MPICRMCNRIVADLTVDGICQRCNMDNMREQKRRLYKRREAGVIKIFTRGLG